MFYEKIVPYCILSITRESRVTTQSTQTSHLCTAVPASAVKGEMLGVVEGLNKAKHFVPRCEKLIVAVDHKPLLGLLNDKSLADIDNPRLIMLKEKTLWYNFQVVWVPGRTNSGPDFMSRLGSETTKQARVNCILGFS